MHKMKSFLMMAGVSGLVSALGCGGEAPSDGHTASGGGEHVNTTSSALTGVQRFQWGQGNNPQVMWSLDQGLCYLTGMWGHFVGNGERVYVTLSNRTWVLTGASQQPNGGVGGAAQCVHWSDLNRGNFFNVSVDNWLVAPNLGTYHNTNWDHNSLCMLAGVQGVFNGAGEYASVTFSTPANDYSWHTNAQDSTGYNETDADAMCVFFHQPSSLVNSTGPSPVGPEISFSQYDGGNWKDLGSSNNQICVLEGVTGSFQGGGEHVEIVNSSGHWWINLTSQQHDVRATVRCLALPAVN
jgi:hypothetical protein